MPPHYPHRVCAVDHRTRAGIEKLGPQWLRERDATERRRVRMTASRHCESVVPVVVVKCRQRGSCLSGMGWPLPARNLTTVGAIVTNNCGSSRGLPGVCLGGWLGEMRRLRTRSRLVSNNTRVGHEDRLRNVCGRSPRSRAFAPPWTSLGGCGGGSATAGQRRMAARSPCA